MALIADLCQFKVVSRLNMKTLYSALAAAGLADTLRGPGPFTLFAPINEGFAQLDPATLQGLLADPAKLAPILTYHVVAGKMTGAEVQAAKTLTSLNGAKITISEDGGRFFADDAKLMLTDGIDCDNGKLQWILNYTR